MAHAKRIRILILHDDPIAEAGLAAAFQRHSDLEVISADEGRHEGLQDLGCPSGISADVVVADYENGIDVSARVSRPACPGGACKVLIVATSDREREIRNALERGVQGYILAGGTLDDLAASVRAVHLGVRHLCPRAVQRLVESFASDALTERQEEVLHLLAAGMNNKMIGRQLGVAVGTVKSHLKGIFEKLQVDSRTQAVCAAERRGLLREGALAKARQGARADRGRVALPTPRTVDRA